MKALLAKLRELKAREGEDCLARYGVFIACTALALMTVIVLWRSAQY
jgi:hypothetical protein